MSLSLNALEMNLVTGVSFNRDPSLGGDRTSAAFAQFVHTYQISAIRGVGLIKSSEYSISSGS
jgi:hypothetical protein